VRDIENMNDNTDNEITALIKGYSLEGDEKIDNNPITGTQSENIGNPLARFEVSSSSGCLPIKIKFINTSVNYDSCSWIFGDGGTSNDNDPEWIFDEEGVYRIGLTVFNKEGQESVTEDSIIVYPRPQARFEISPENVIIPDDEVHFMNYSSNAVSYKWEFGDGNSSEDYEPVYRYNNNGKYNVRLIVKTEYGCIDSLVVENAFAGSAYYITFPNAFIPNSGGPAGGYYSLKSDEAAQVFHPVSSGIAEYQLRIFSKRGILIFESNDINIGWDGYYKGQLSEPGVYIWKVRGEYINGETFVKMGDVTLLKN
jgi:PKD repeat protein